MSAKENSSAKKPTSFDDYVRLSTVGDLSTKFSTQQLVCLHKVANNQLLTATDRRVLREGGLLENEDELSITGRMCVMRIKKKRKRRTGGRRKTFNWEKNDG